MVNCFATLTIQQRTTNRKRFCICLHWGEDFLTENYKLDLRHDDCLRSPKRGAHREEKVSKWLAVSDIWWDFFLCVQSITLDREYFTCMSKCRISQWWLGACMIYKHSGLSWTNICPDSCWALELFGRAGLQCKDQLRTVIVLGHDRRPLHHRCSVGKVTRTNGPCDILQRSPINP